MEREERDEFGKGRFVESVDLRRVGIGARRMRRGGGLRMK